MATLTLGAGIAPAGVSAAGFGVPATADSPGAPTLGSRKIDPLTRDYVTTSAGVLDRSSTAEQLVYLAMATELDSSAVKGLGLAPAPDRFTGRVLEDVAASLRSALARAVADGVLELLEVTVTRDAQVPTRMHRKVRFRDLLTGQELTLIG